MEAAVNILAMYAVVVGPLVVALTLLILVPARYILIRRKPDGPTGANLFFVAARCLWIPVVLEVAAVAGVFIFFQLF